MKWINYNKKLMSLSFEWKWKGKRHCKFLTCPFATWWKARKYFKRPKFNFYFGPTCKFNGHKVTEFGEYDDWERKGFWPAVSTEFIKWCTPKWFPITIISQDIGWKDKWSSPRYETPGYFIIYFGRSYHHSWQIGFSVTAPKFFIYDCTILDFEDLYWESMLWYVYYKNRDLIAVRNSLQNHWSTSNSTNIKKFKIMSTEVENVLNKEYFVVSLKCKYLLNKLFWDFSLTSEKKISISVKKDKECRTMFSSFMCNIENNIVKVYIFKSTTDIHINKFIEMLQDNPDDVEIDFIVGVDLGPTFKDQFLNKRGIKLIQDEYKRNKENGK